MADRIKLGAVFDCSAQLRLRVGQTDDQREMPAVTWKNPILQIAEVTGSGVFVVTRRFCDPGLQTVVTCVVDDLGVVALLANVDTELAKPVWEFARTSRCIDDHVGAV